jgi:hypothetical protein
MKHSQAKEYLLWNLFYGIVVPRSIKRELIILSNQQAVALCIYRDYYSVCQLFLASLLKYPTDGAGTGYYACYVRTSCQWNINTDLDR